MKGLSDTYVESVIRALPKGRMTARQAAAKLGITRQYANRLRKAYAEEGPPCLGHGNSGRTSPLRTDSETEGRITSLYKGKYEGLNFRHFAEKLREDEGIEMPYGAIYRMLRSAGIKSPKRHKARKEKAKHPSRPRREGFGELLQIDASCIGTIVAMIVYGFLGKGFAIGWKIHNIFWWEWFCGDLN